MWPPSLLGERCWHPFYTSVFLFKFQRGVVHPEWAWGGIGRSVGYPKSRQLALLGFLIGLVVDNSLKRYPLVWATSTESSISTCASVEVFQLTELTFAPLHFFFFSFMPSFFQWTVVTSCVLKHWGAYWGAHSFSRKDRHINGIIVLRAGNGYTHRTLWRQQRVISCNLKR